MKTAVLTHTHKHGHDTYVSLVGDHVTMDDSESIIKAMVKAHSVDYEKTTPEQDAMGDGEELSLRLYDQGEIGVVSVGNPVRNISPGTWRYSEEGEEVTTSRRGVLEGSKRVCQVSTFAKIADEIRANGRALAAVPEMLSSLRQIVQAADDSDNEKPRDLVEAIDWKAARRALKKAGRG